MQIVLHIVSWGERYNKSLIDRLLHGIILVESPNLLASIDLEISTDDCDFFRYNPLLNFFKSVSFYPINLKIQDKYERTSQAEQAFVNRSTDKLMLFLPPDVVLSAGSLQFAIDKILSGKKMFAASGVMAPNELIPPLGVSGKELINWCFNNLHDFTRHQIWGNVPSFDHASSIFFHCETGFVGRHHHLHPIAVMHSGKDMKFTNTVDDDLVSLITPEDTYVMQSTDEFCMVELSPSNRGLLPVRNHYLTVDIVNKFRSRPNVRAIHRHFFNQRITYNLIGGINTALDEVIFPETNKKEFEEHKAKPDKPPKQPKVDMPKQEYRPVPRAKFSEINMKRIEKRRLALKSKGK